MRRREKAFIAAYENTVNSMGDDEVVVLADAVRPTHAARPVGCWAPKQQKLAIEPTSGREPINVHGAVNPESGQTRMIEAETMTRYRRFGGWKRWKRCPPDGVHRRVPGQPALSPGQAGERKLASASWRANGCRGPDAASSCMSCRPTARIRTQSSGCGVRCPRTPRTTKAAKHARSSPNPPWISCPIRFPTDRPNGPTRSQAFSV